MPLGGERADHDVAVRAGVGVLVGHEGPRLRAQLRVPFEREAVPRARRATRQAPRPGQVPRCAGPGGGEDAVVADDCRELDEPQPLGVLPDRDRQRLPAPRTVGCHRSGRVRRRIRKGGRGGGHARRPHVAPRAEDDLHLRALRRVQRDPPLLDVR